MKSDFPLVHYGSSYTYFTKINAGVPHTILPINAILPPFLYSIFMADFRIINETTVPTYADDTAILSAFFDIRNI